MIGVDLVHRQLHGQGGRRPSLGVVGMRERRAEDREDRVADELVDGAAMRDDDLGHAGEVAVEDLHDVSGIAVLGEPRIAAQVRHQDRHHALLSAEAQPLGRLQERLHDLGGDVAAERAADEIALAEALDHPVERARELTDLVARAHGQRLREVAAGHAGHAARQRADGTRDAPREEEPEHQRGQGTGQGGLQDRHGQLAGAVEKDLDRIVDHERRDVPAVVDDRRHGGDPLALAVVVDPGVAGNPVLHGPRERVRQLGRHGVGLAGALIVVAAHDDAGPTARAIVIGHRVDGRGEDDLRLHAGEPLLETRVRWRVDRPRALEPLVGRRVDEDRRRPRDVEQLGADHVLDLALLALISEGPDEADGKKGYDGEEDGEADAEAAPDPGSLPRHLLLHGHCRRSLPRCRVPPAEELTRP